MMKLKKPTESEMKTLKSQILVVFIASIGFPAFMTIQFSIEALYYFNILARIDEYGRLVSHDNVFTTALLVSFPVFLFLFFKSFKSSRARLKMALLNFVAGLGLMFLLFRIIEVNNNDPMRKALLTKYYGNSFDPCNMVKIGDSLSSIKQIEGISLSFSKNIKGRKFYWYTYKDSGEKFPLFFKDGALIEMECFGSKERISK